MIFASIKYDCAEINIAAGQCLFYILSCSGLTRVGSRMNSDGVVGVGWGVFIKLACVATYLGRQA